MEGLFNNLSLLRWVFHWSFYIEIHWLLTLAYVNPGTVIPGPGTVIATARMFKLITYTCNVIYIIISYNGIHMVFSAK